jgi:MoaA/NifB/PqqE/SkfB family radical SAM enzyme
MNSNNMLSKLLCRLVGGLYNAALKDFPRVVRIESTNACNAECVICPHHKMLRPTRRMDQRLYEKIIDECARANCKEVHLHNFGEPFLDKRLEQFVVYAKGKGIKKIKVFSNGSIITRERARGILLAGIDEIKVSFDGANREEFEKIRTPLKFDEVVENLINLVDLRNELKSPAKVMVACCSTTDKSKTMDVLAAKVDGFSFGKIHNWGGEDALAGNIRKPCSRLWRTFTILVDGSVSLCCLDYNGVVNLGNVNTDSIAGIWASTKYRETRALHTAARQEALTLCANCSKAFW